MTVRLKIKIGRPISKSDGRAITPRFRREYSISISNMLPTTKFSIVRHIPPAHLRQDRSNKNGNDDASPLYETSNRLLQFRTSETKKEMANRRGEHGTEVPPIIHIASV